MLSPSPRVAETSGIDSWGDVKEWARTHCRVDDEFTYVRLV